MEPKENIANKLKQLKAEQNAQNKIKKFIIDEMLNNNVSFYVAYNKAKIHRGSDVVNLNYLDLEIAVAQEIRVRKRNQKTIDQNQGFTTEAEKPKKADFDLDGVAQFYIENAFEQILRVMQLDIKDPNLKETPHRIAKMYINELCKGLYEPEPKFTTFPNPKYDEMVTLFNINVKSLCSHHFLPFIGKAHIGYIPNETICGISKLVRVVQWFMRRPQIQEGLTEQIADYLVEKLNPKGVIVVIEAQHHCMIVRGVEEYDSIMKTSAVRGVFVENIGARREFFNLKGL